MKNYLAAALLAAGLSTIAAPVIAAGDDTTRMYRPHEFALDVAPLLRQQGFFQQPNPFTIMYRFHINDASALRLRANASIQDSKTSATNFSEDQQGNRQQTDVSMAMKGHSLDLRAGYQRFVGTGKIRFYFGVDAIVQSSNNRTDNEQNFYRADGVRNNKSTTNMTMKGLGFGGAPVLGFNWKVSRGFSMGLENSIPVVATTFKNEFGQDFRFYDFQGNEINHSMSNSTQKSNTLSVDFAPALNLMLFLSVHF